MTSSTFLFSNTTTTTWAGVGTPPERAAAADELGVGAALPAGAVVPVGVPAADVSEPVAEAAPPPPQAAVAARTATASAAAAAARRGCRRLIGPGCDCG